MRHEWEIPCLACTRFLLEVYYLCYRNDYFITNEGLMHVGNYHLLYYLDEL